MELREKVAGMIFDAPLNPSDKACHAIADAILAIPEIAEALAKHERRYGEWIAKNRAPNA